MDYLIFAYLWYNLNIDMYRAVLFLLALILAQQQATSVKYYPPLPILVSEYTTFIPVNGSEIISS